MNNNAIKAVRAITISVILSNASAWSATLFVEIPKISLKIKRVMLKSKSKRFTKNGCS